MEQSEIAFKYHKSDTVTSIPDEVLTGEYYINTGSGYMFLKTAVDDGILHPGIIYDISKDQTSAYESAEDGYLGINAKKFLVFEKQGAHRGKFVPRDVSNMLIVTSDPAEIIGGEVKVKVHSPYIDDAKAVLEGGNMILSIMGYMDPTFKAASAFGTSSMVQLLDIDDNGYATVGVHIGYLLMKDIPTANALISKPVLGMAWHNGDSTVVLHDNMTMIVYTPKDRIVHRSAVSVHDDHAIITSFGLNHVSVAKVVWKDSSKEDILSIILKWLPTNDVNAIPSQGNLCVTNDTYDIDEDGINMLLYSGWKTSYEATVFPDIVSMQYHKGMLGFDINSNIDVELPIAINNGKIYSFIHGDVCSNVPSVNKLYIKFTPSQDTIEDMYHICAVSLCNSADLLGGEDSIDPADKNVFILIDYQQIGISSGADSKSAPLRKYIRCSNITEDLPSSANNAFVAKYKASFDMPQGVIDMWIG